MSELVAKKIVHYLRAQHKEMLDFLENLVAIETPSKDPKSQEMLFAVLQPRLLELGFYVLHVPGQTSGGYLYARPLLRDRTNPLQLVLGHCDTVWDKRTISHMPVTRADGKMTGPGVYDMKVGLTQLVYALKAINELKLTMPLCLLVLINSDEEIGSRESGPAIRKLAKISERALVLEPPLGLDGKLKTGRKGLGRFTITVKGRAAHAGLDPDKGINAIVELSRLVQELYAMNDFENGITVNVGMIQGGISPNVVAPQCNAVVDVRVLHTADGEQITKKIYGLQPSRADIELRVEGGMGRPPMERTPRNQKLWKLARAKAALIDLELEEGIAGGGSDGNTTSQYTATLDGLGTSGDGAHASHEFIFMEDIVDRTALLSLLLLSGSVAQEIQAS